MFNDNFCDRYDNKDECLTLWKHLLGDLVLDNGHLLDQVLRKSGILPRSPQGTWDHIAEEMLLQFAESGHPIFRATTPLSRGQLKSKGKGKVSIHFFSADTDTVDTIYRITLSVNQLSVYGAVAAICEEFEDHQDRTGQPVILVGQSIVLDEVQRLLSTMKIPEMTKLFGSNTFNKLNRFHQKTDWVNFVRKQDLCVLLKLDNISWPRILVILDNFNQWLVANSPFHETTKLLNQKGGSKEIWELDLYWKSRPVLSISSMELKFELSPWTKMILTLGSEFLMERSNMWSILLKTIQKILQIHKKRKVYKQAQVWLQPGQRQKQNSTEGICWHNNYTISWKKMNWHWAIKARSRFVWSLEESH